MANFTDSLSIGKKVENEVCELIQKKYPRAYVKEGYFKDCDIIVPETNTLVEVKLDRKSHETGNFLIEIEFDGVESALSTTKADWWVLVDRDYFYWIAPESLRYIISNLNLRVAEFVGNGDTRSKKAYLVPKEKIIYSSYTTTMKRTKENDVC